MTNTALKQNINDIGTEATLLQMTASDPSYNVWVNASAGTGKTKVLTERVLRLLLPLEGVNDGTDPQNILCVTFTKAGANEMIERVMKTLSKWAVCSEGKLDESLTNLLGHAPSIKQRDKARRLFAMVIDLPNGLNITTIHALCQSILGRFTIEAGLPPNFTVMEESEAQSILRSARDGLVREILNREEAHPLYDGFTWLAGIKNSDQINKLLNNVLSDRKKLAEFFQSHPDYKADLRAYLQIVEGDTEDSLLTHALYDDLPEDKIRQLAKAFEYGAKTNQTNALTIYDFLNGDRAALLNDYKLVFLKTDGDKRQASAISAGAKNQDPQAEDIFLEEQDRLLTLQDRINTLKIYRATTIILDIAHEITHRYQSLKIHHRKVDYDDLIHKTLDLLNSDKKDWVLFKLDYGIDHILVDEAQDTSPDQWGILQSLWSDFFSGETGKTEDGITRTVFVVGDNKQSIFSFQGANLDTFNTVHDTLMTHVQTGQKPWEDVPMNTSFRSTSAVLDSVDATFDNEDLKCSLTQNPDHYRNHTAFRQGHAGRVEIWPVYKAPKAETLPPWALPLKIRDSHDANQALANRIAETIAEWIENDTLLKSKNRPIAAGDIMILVRRRNALVDHLIRALKTHNVPVSGADRLVIANHIGVQDVLAALSFALMPEDDLTLATLLKSPFIGWDDATIEDYAYNREGRSLWSEIKSRAPAPVTNWLSALITSITGQNAFSAVSNILNFKTANTDKSGWQALITRLGEDCIDPLEELLSMAQSHDANNPGASVQGFLHFMQTNQTDIKRELDSSDNKVRIMTVHASKGLQAPIVFMPDTIAIPKSATSDDGLLWTKEGMPLWSPSSATDNDLIQSFKETGKSATLDEYYRLLYVAMTRAEDRLIICGTLNGKQKSVPEKSWYQCAMTAMGKMGAQEHDWPFDEDYDAPEANTRYRIVETDQTAESKHEEKKHDFDVQDALPDWATMALTAEHTPPRILKPSQDDSEPVPVRSPLLQTDDSYRFRRGLLTHSLLQYLPDITTDMRESAGRTYLDKQAPDVSEAVRSEILTESLNILTEFAEFFGTGSFAEVPVTGTVTNANGKIDIISGQIDRLLIRDTSIWIIDFKSNRPPPRDPNDVPAQYRKQLAAYKILIQGIYPDHTIRCALLWTDGPFMTELENL